MRTSTVTFMQKNNQIHQLLTRGVAEILPSKKELKDLLLSGKKLRVKFGIDPTGPHLHLGHTVPILKLKEFQDLGHKIIYIVGDFTARIGDPSGKDKTRPPLPQKQIEKNAKTYFDQAFKILDPKKTEVHLQSEWYDKFQLAQVIELLNKATYQQLMKHKTFRRRIKLGADLGAHELFYPFLQAYDSVSIKADVEIGAIEQKFNLLMGRQIQERFGQKPQKILMVDYLLGVDGKEKMSKSLGNYIAIAEKPSQMYGKIMSVPDNLIVQYFQLATKIAEGKIKSYKKEFVEGKNPMVIKKILAREIVKIYHGEARALEAHVEFEKVFQKGKLPSKIPEVSLSVIRDSLSVIELLTKTGLVPSKSEAKRLVQQKAVEIDGQPITDHRKPITVKNGMIIRVGKRKFAKIKLKGE